MVLLGLLMAMVILATLGAALLPITASSQFTLVSANSSMKAYYLAEAGYRYAGSRFLHGGSTEDARDGQLEALHNQTFTLADNYGTFYLEIYPFYYKTTANPTGNSLPTKIPGGFLAGRIIPTPGRLKILGKVYSYENFVRNGSNVTFIGSTNWPSIPVGTTVLPVGVSLGSQQQITRGGDLVLSSGADAFPQYWGTFKVGNTSGVYLYRKRNGNKLERITLFSDPLADFTKTVPANSDIVLLKYLELHSTGTLGGGLMYTRREVIYRGPIAATSSDQGEGGASQPENSVDLSMLAAASGHTNTGEFETVNLGGDQALHVKKTTSGSGSGNQPSVEAYVMLPPGSTNPIYQSWEGAGSYLSYDLQVKVATGVWNGNYFQDKPSTYCAGVTFRASPLSNQSTFYGLSLMRTISGHGHESDGIQDTMLPRDDYENRAMIVLWTRNGNQANGDDHWLAYKLLDETVGSDYIVDNEGKVKDWSTLMVRVVEAASLKLNVNDAPNVSVGEIITGGSGTARVYKKINDNDGKVVLLLTNVEGTFSLPPTVKGYTTNPSWGFRPRDNYIWAFFTDTADHSADATAINNIRLGEPRATINWPITEIQGWNGQNDKFTLVQWAGELNISPDGDNTLRLMGTGKEQNAIIRTNKWTTENYQAASFPPEIGVVSLGENSVKTYFDDLAFYLRGAFDGAGNPIGFLPPLQQ